MGGQAPFALLRGWCILSATGGPTIELLDQPKNNVARPRRQ